MRPAPVLRIVGERERESPADDRGGVTLRDVTKIFQVRGRPVVALERASISSSPGEFVALLGPSGCGKSTILRILADLENPTGGVALLHGEAPKAARRR